MTNSTQVGTEITFAGDLDAPEFMVALRETMNGPWASVTRPSTREECEQRLAELVADRDATVAKFEAYAANPLDEGDRVHAAEVAGRNRMITYVIVHRPVQPWTIVG